MKFYYDQENPQWFANADCPLWAIKEYEAQVPTRNSDQDLAQGNC